MARPRAPEQYREVIGSSLEESVLLVGADRVVTVSRARREPGRSHVRRTQEDLAKLLTDVSDYYEAPASEAGVTLAVHVRRDRLMANVDRVLLQRAIGNLIANSLAHCGAGATISLTAARSDGQIQIEVRDTGAGIPAHVLPQVFDRLYRGDPARSRNSGGAGLGLAIVRQIVHLHGGDVQITSEVGVGTTVTLLLPERVTEQMS